MNTTLKYYYSQDLNEKLKLMGGAMKFFSKKLLGHEIFSYMVCWATKFYLKNLKKSPHPLPPIYLMYGPLDQYKSVANETCFVSVSLQLHMENECIAPGEGR